MKFHLPEDRHLVGRPRRFWLIQIPANPDSIRILNLETCEVLQNFDQMKSLRAKKHIIYKNILITAVTARKNSEPGTNTT